MEVSCGLFLGSLFGTTPLGLPAFLMLFHCTGVGVRPRQRLACFFELPGCSASSLHSLRLALEKLLGPLRRTLVPLGTALEIGGARFALSQPPLLEIGNLASALFLALACRASPLLATRRLLGLDQALLDLDGPLVDGLVPLRAQGL